MDLLRTFLRPEGLTLIYGPDIASHRKLLGQAKRSRDHTCGKGDECRVTLVSGPRTFRGQHCITD
eukprot:9412534-Alexandrium_andersonii.AAC.1